MNVQSKYQRILALGTERVDQLNAFLLCGEPTPVLAEKIQVFWNVFTEVKTETLARQLRRYRADTIPALMAKLDAAVGREV